MGDRNLLAHPSPPRWRKGLGVGLVSPKAMNNKAQGRFSAPWDRDRCPNQTSTRFYHECAWCRCTQWNAALLCNRFAVGNA